MVTQDADCWAGNNNAHHHQRPVNVFSPPALSLSLPLVGSFFSLFEDEMTASRFIFKPLKKLTKKKEKEAMGG